MAFGNMVACCHGAPSISLVVYVSLLRKLFLVSLFGQFLYVVGDRSSVVGEMCDENRPRYVVNRFFHCFVLCFLLMTNFELAPSRDISFW